MHVCLLAWCTKLTCFRAVDLPLDADMGAAVRQLCRRLCALRAAGSGDASRPEADVLGRLNILLAIAGEFFGAARTAAYT